MTQNKLVVVTGGGTGIGAATAQRLRDQGIEVLITGRRGDVLERLASDIGCRFVVADVSSEDDNRRVVEEIEATGMPLFGLVHAAGAMIAGTVAETSVSSWQQALDVNLTGPFMLTQKLLPLLRRSSGSIVMVASVAADRTPAGMAAYAVSKAGLVALSNSLAVEEGSGEQPVRCNVVNPGWTRTEMADQEMRAASELLGGLDVEDAYAEVTSLVPLGRPAEAREVASVVSWLLSADASYVNGACIAIDGGHRLIDAGAIPFEWKLTKRP